ncbi:MAG: GTP 3',8-cyclase MoaA [Clostridiaceae bacterium]|nr:GTP 3',8-cyclase MoaA [Clostridiaceae bacterium]
MRDSYGRDITYLRLSVTQKCNLRCVYCNPDSCPEASGQHLLSVEEIHRICRLLYQDGIRRIRLTGGEPLLRKDLEEITAAIRSISDEIDLSLSTNGQGLAPRAAALKRAGLNRVNISMDSTDADKYRRLTGGGNLDDTLAAIDACLACGITPVKVNAVLLKSINDDGITQMIELTKERPLEVRFIELMPMSNLGRNPKLQMAAEEILMLEPRLIKIEQQDPHQPAVRYMIPGYAGTVGLIQPMSHQFCHSCNRIRITADGMFKPCLGSIDEISLLPALQSDDDKQLAEVLRQALFSKPRGHNFSNDFIPSRDMNKTGG